MRLGICKSKQCGHYKVDQKIYVQEKERAPVPNEPEPAQSAPSGRKKGELVSAK